METANSQPHNLSKGVPVFIGEREGTDDSSTHMCVNIKNREKIEYFKQHEFGIIDVDSGFPP